MRVLFAAMSLGGRAEIDELPTGSEPRPAAAISLGLSEMGDRYELSERLGAGGMGEVWRAYDRQLDRDVALKFLHVRDEAVQTRVLDEARAQARIDHAHIRKVYEVGTLGGRPYIAMQLLDGETLQRAAARLSVERRIELMLQAVDALSAAHAAGLLHLDLKPANLFVEERDGGAKVWVMDFGLARRAGQVPTGEVRGTPRYMAPEQLRGQTDQFGPATDVYSLGVTLFEVVTGKTPRDLDMTNSRISSVSASSSTTADIVTSPETPSATGGFHLPPSAHLDDSLRRIIERCLAPVIVHRYSDAAALAEDLRRYQRGEPLTGDRALPTRRWARLLQKRIGAVLLGVGIAAGLVLLGWGGLALRDARRLAAAEDRFSREATEAEQLLGLGYVRPVHALSAERGRVVAWQNGLVKQLDQLPEAARSPAEAALGRSYLLLGDETRARAVLEPLWQRGYHTSAVALALGTTLGRLYEKERSTLELGARESQSPATLERLTQTLRDPALAYLRYAKSAGGNSELIQGEIALLEEHFDVALAGARAALQKNPTLFEAHVLIGRVRYQQAIAAYFGDRIGDADKALEEARRAVGSAIEHARSYPPAYVLWCRLSYLHINLEYWGSGKIDLTRAADDLQRCGTAAELAPEGASLEWLARFSYKLARAERDRNLESTPLLYAAIVNAEVAVAQRRQTDAGQSLASAYDALANAYSELASANAASGIDSDVSYLRALWAGSAASVADPGSAVYLYDHALTLGDFAAYEDMHGQDPRPHLSQAVVALRRAIDLDPSQVNRLALVEHYCQMAVADSAIGVPADNSLQNAWAALHDAYPTPADTALYHAITAELLHESARADFERGRDPAPALAEELNHLRRCQALSPDEPSYRMLEMASLHALAERHLAYRQSAATELAAADRLYAARPASANDILWAQSALQNAVTEAEWLIANKKPPTVALRRARERVNDAQAVNPHDNEVTLIEAQVDLIEGAYARTHGNQNPRGAQSSLDRAITQLRTELVAVPQTVGGWVFLAIALRERAELAASLSSRASALGFADEAQKAIDRGLQIVHEQPRLLCERAALTELEHRLGRDVDLDDASDDLARGLELNRHLAWRYDALKTMLTSRR